MARQLSSRLVRRMRAAMALSVACAVAAVPAVADPARWYSAKRIDFVIVAEYSGRAEIDATGDAQMKDRIEFSLSTDLAGTITKPIQFKNFPSTLGDIRSRERGCRAPVLQGPLEWLTVERVETPANSTLGAIMHVRVDYPTMLVSKFCTGSVKQEARTIRKAEPFHVPTVGEFLVNPAAYRDTGITVNEANGTMVVVSDNGKMPGRWTWTFKATPH